MFSAISAQEQAPRIEELYTLIEMMATMRRTSAFVVVEGEKDARIYSKIFDDHGRCELLFQHNWGRELIERAFSIDHRFRPQMLGVIDQDFDFALPNRTYSDGLVVTPTHDLETLVLSTAAFERLILFWTDPEGRALVEARCGAPLATAILRAARPLGLFRLADFLRKENGLPGMNFQDIPFETFVDPSTLALDLDGLIKWVLTVNTDHPEVRTVSVSEIRAEIEDLDRIFTDDWLVCQGHDIDALLVLALNACAGSEPRRRFSFSLLKRCLNNMAILTAEDLYQTDLCERIRKWEETHPPYRALKSLPAR